MLETSEEADEAGEGERGGCCSDGTKADAKLVEDRGVGGATDRLGKVKDGLRESG